MAARSIHTAAQWHGQGTRPTQGTLTGTLAGTLLFRLRRAWQVIATRHILAEMDDRMLADIGISRAQAQLEANRAPWDVGARN